MSLGDDFGKNIERKLMTLDELTSYCETHMDDIFVREQVNGKWGTYPLGALSYPVAMKHIEKWFEDGITPARRMPCNPPK